MVCLAVILPQLFGLNLLWDPTIRICSLWSIYWGGGARQHVTPINLPGSLTRRGIKKMADRMWWCRPLPFWICTPLLQKGKGIATFHIQPYSWMPLIGWLGSPWSITNKPYSLGSRNKLGQTKEITLVEHNVRMFLVNLRRLQLPLEIAWFQNGIKLWRLPNWESAVFSSWPYNFDRLCKCSFPTCISVPHNPHPVLDCPTCEGQEARENQ